MEEANETTVAEFRLLGFSGVHDKLQMFLFFVLLLTYLVTLTGNSLIIFIVWVDHRLHTPHVLFHQQSVLLGDLVHLGHKPQDAVELSLRQQNHLIPCLHGPILLLFRPGSYGVHPSYGHVL